MANAAPLHRALRRTLILAASLAVSGCVSHYHPWDPPHGHGDEGAIPRPAATASPQPAATASPQTTADTGGQTVTGKSGNTFFDVVEREAAAAAERRKQPAYQHRTKGDAFLKQENYAAAIREYDAVIKLTPNDQVIYVQKGIALAAMGRPESAIPLFDKAISLNVRSKSWLWWPLSHKGDALYQAGQYKKSIAVYTGAIAANPSADNFVARARSFTQMGELEISLADFERASKASPKWSYPWKMRSVLYAMIAERDRDPDAAAQACQAAAKACGLGDCETARQFENVCAQHQ